MRLDELVAKLQEQLGHGEDDYGVTIEINGESYSLDEVTSYGDGAVLRAS